jgi:hypothetical protein
MAYNPNNPNGQTTAANSAPVVIASDQTAVNASLQEIATGGASVFHLVSLSGTNPTNIKNGPGKITGWFIYNNTGVVKKVAFHNNAGTPTAGTGVYFSIVIPPLSAANCSFPAGINFSTGIAITTTSGLADSDTSIVNASDLSINIFFK